MQNTNSDIEKIYKCVAKAGFEPTPGVFHMEGYGMDPLTHEFPHKHQAAILQDSNNVHAHQVIVFLPKILNLETPFGCEKKINGRFRKCAHNK